MAVTQTCKALKFVPVRENFDRAKVTEQLKDLRGLTAITQPRVLGIVFLQVSTKLTVQLYLIEATRKPPIISTKTFFSLLLAYFCHEN